MKRLSHAVSRCIMRRAAQNKPIVLTCREGSPATVWGLSEYLERKKLPTQVMPWKHKKGAKQASACPDPLGTVEGSVQGKLSRAELYE